MSHRVCVYAAEQGVPFSPTIDARAALNALLAALPDGATVVFPSGAVALLSANVEVPAGVDNVTIVGNGATLKLASGASSGAYVLDLAGDGATVTDLVIDGNSVTDATGIRLRGDRQTVTGCTLTNCRSGGIYLPDDAADFAVTGCRFTGDGYGVLTDSDATCGPGVIASNRFHPSARGDAIELNTPDGGAHDITISGNTVRGYSGASADHGIGIGVANTTAVVITGNTITSCGGDGIHVEDAATDTTISDNTIRGCGRAGVSVQVGAGSVAPTDWAVTGNTITGCGGTTGPAAIAIEGLTPVSGGVITGNVLAGNGRAGAAEFWGIDLGYLSTDIAVTGNLITGCIGIATAAVRGSWPTGMSITGNVLVDRAVSPTQDYGLRLEGNVTGVVVAANVLTPNGTNPIHTASLGTTSEYLKTANVPNSVNDA